VEAACGFGVGFTDEGFESGSSSTRRVGLGLRAPGANTETPGVLGACGLSFGAVLVFQAGLTLGANLDLEAVTLIVSSLKKMSKVIFGIGIE